MQGKIKNSKNPNVKLIADELDRVAAISAIADMEGGKLLISQLISEIVSSIDTLSTKYRTLTIQEFIGHCADMESKLSLVRTLKKARKNKDIAETDLAEALLQE